MTERVQFVGYNTQLVRWYSFIIAGFFAGIGGALGTINFEIFNAADSLSGLRSGAYLLFTFLGGVTFFFGPIIGAVLMVIATVLLSELTSAWLLYLGLIFVAMQWVEASVVSIIASTMPLMVAFFGWLLMGQRLKPMAITGLVAGVIGVSLIMGARITGGIDLAGLALCLLATLALTVATLTVRSAAAGGNVLMIVGLQMLVGAVAVGIAALLFETWTVTWSPRLLAAFTYTTLVPGLLATWVWFRLVGRIGAVKAASFHFLNPFFGVAVAAALLGERLGSLDLIGVAIIAISIFMVQMSKREPAPREAS